MIKSFEEYMSLSPEINYVHYWDLPDTLFVILSKIKPPIKLRGKSITVRKLVEYIGKSAEAEKLINYIVDRKGNLLKIEMPINLESLDYVKLYALMNSEGYYKREFSIHVPEREFHKIFEDCLTNIFNSYVIRTKKKSRGILRSRAMNTIRHLIPIPPVIPKLILKNREFSREYLRIVFEAEGSPIFSGSKRYVKISRSINITDIADGIDYKEGERIYFGRLKKEQPRIIKKILNRPPLILLGEYFLLLHHFGIESIIKPEALRINKTSYRRGKVSMRWILYIYSDSLDKFIREINFITPAKKNIAMKMSLIKGYRKKYSSIKIIKRISENNIFLRSAFIKEMKILGYKSPSAYLWRYEKKGIIRRIRKGIYKLLVN